VAASAPGQGRFQTLVEAGYQPEIACSSACELRLIVDLMYQGGLNYMRYSVSDTAEHGDYTGGPRIITDETRKEMRQMLAEIQNGTYAKNWIDEDRKGRPWFNAQREKEQNQRLEEVGAKLRELMPFLKPVKHRQPAGV
jgi:ketol-acid reductoisomerase